MAQVRHASMMLIREFVRQTPADASVVIAGRSQFFDSEKELEAALGVDESFVRLTLNDFTNAQIARFLMKGGYAGAVPTWIPARPLLLGYLAARGFLKDVVEVGDDHTPEESWDLLLDLISAREANINPALDGEAVRGIIEQLASVARATTDGRGPLTFADLEDAFVSACGHRPDDLGAVLLQRLPGLGLRDVTDDSRQFIDEQFVDAARAGDVARFLFDPFSTTLDAESWLIPIGDLGAAVTAAKARRVGLAPAQFQLAIQRAAEERGAGTLAADVLRVALMCGVGFEGRNVYIREADIGLLELSYDMPDISPVELQDCVVLRLEIDATTPNDRLPSFNGCLIAVLEGRVESDMPFEKFTQCSVETASGTTETTAGIMELALPSGVRVALTVLKKLYLQRGAGRKESAFSRGIDPASRRLVEPVLREVEREGLATHGKIGSETIYYPVRSSAARVHRILASPSSDDSLLNACRAL